MRAFLLLIFVFLLMPFLNAQEDLASFRIFQENISQSESFQAEINFNIPPETFKAASVKVRDGRNNEVRTGLLFIKLSDTKYFISFEVPSYLEDEVYVLAMEKVQFIMNNKLEERTFRRDFNVQRQDNSLLILPSFMHRPTTLFHININSLASDNLITFEAPDFIDHPYSLPQLVEEGKKKTFKFTLKDRNFGYAEIKIKSAEREFTVPIYNDIAPEAIMPEPAQKEEEKAAVAALEFLTNVSMLNRTISRSQILEGPLSFRNTGEKALANLSFRLTGNLDEIVKINMTDVSFLEVDHVMTQYVIVNRETSPASAYYSGLLILGNDEVSISLPFAVSFLDAGKEETPLEKVGKEIQVFADESLQPLQELPQYVQERKQEGLGTIFFIVVLSIIIMAAYLLTRKKKEKLQFKDYLGKIKK